MVNEQLDIPGGCHLSEKPQFGTTTPSRSEG